MASIHIQRFCEKDAGIIVNLLKKLAAFHGDSILISEDSILKQCIGSHPPALCWLAWHEEQAIGFAIAYDWMNFLRAKKIRHLDLIFVEEAFRTQGIGEMLVKHLAREALDAGCSRLDVAAQETNTGANGFYKALGFEGSPSHSVKYKIQDHALHDLIHS